MHYRELFTRRLVIGDFSNGHPRAVLEADRDGVRITLHGGHRQPSLVLEAKPDQPPRIVIGDPERGPSVEIEPEGIWIWQSGNAVAALRARENGGEIDLCDANGVPVRSLPKRDA